MSFDFLTTKRILRKLGGDKISGKKYTFDGNTAGKETIPGEMMGLSGVYVKVSNTAFAVDELQSVSATTVFDGVKETNEIPLSAITVQKDGRVALLVQSEMPIAIVVAENFSSEEFSMTVGTYFLCDENCLNLGTYYVSSITCGKETIVPIDPKYLPNKAVDFDKLGLTAPILELFNTGGGAAPVGTGETTNEKILNGFPLNGEYIAKLTIPDRGTMTVNPICTLFDEEGFHSAHFDSYITVSGTLTKFYVRVLRPGVNYRDYVTVEVGFYT